MILFLFGKDTFRSRQQLHRMITKFKADRDPSGMNVVQLDAGKNNDADQVIEQILAAPFLAERRLVVCENLLISKQLELRKNLLARIEDANLPDSTVLLIWEGTDTFKTKDAKEMFERLRKEKYAQEFSPLTGVKLSGWIAEEAAARGGKMEPPAISYLAANTKGNMWSVNSLLDQLIAYKGSAPVTLSDVKLFLDERADDNIFNLVDALIAKQGPRVFAMMREQYRNGEDAGYLFAMILRQCRILLGIRDFLDREPGAHSELMAGKLKLHPFVVKKTIPFAKKYSLAELRRMYEDLLQIDVKTKTGQGEQSVLLDVFVAKVCTQ